MFIKLLSTVASVLGNARNRAAIVSCFVVFFAAGSIVLVMNRSESDAAHVGRTSDADSTRAEIWVQGSRQERRNQQNVTVETTKKPQEQTSVSQKTTEEKTGGSNTQPSLQAPNKTELGLNQNSINLTAGTTSAIIAATITTSGDASNWTFKTIEPDNFLVEPVEETGRSFSFRVRGAQNLAAGTYQITIKATADDGSSYTKILTINVVEQ